MEKLFATDQLTAGWDGLDLNGQPVPTGTYTYRIRGVGFFLEEITLN